MNMIISVTQQDIADGIPKRWLKCPIALAVSRATQAEAGVCRKVIDIYAFGPKRIAIKTPPKAKRFIDRFDSAQPVKPFTFNLEIP